MNEKIKIVDETHPKISQEKFSDALGAEKVSESSSGNLGFISGIALRQELAKIVSTGGRPGLKDATKRPKIPMSDDDWNKLESIAQKAHISAGQVAGVLLRTVLSQTNIENLADEIKKNKDEIKF